MEGRKLYVLFIDFKSAFPSINHNLLLNKLYLMGVGTKFVNIVKDLYSKATVSVKLKSGISEPIRFTKGVMQGEVLSPFMFSLFIADFEEFLRSRGVRGVAIDHITKIVLLAYADDIAISADSLMDMRKILTYLKEYCELNGLEVNLKKQRLLYLEEEDIVITKNYRFLNMEIVRWK